MTIISKPYVDVVFVESRGREVMDLINPTTEKIVGQVTLGDKEDARCAIAAAKRAPTGSDRTTGRSDILSRHVYGCGVVRGVIHEGDVMAGDADGSAEAVALPHGVAQVLADPIVQALMAADKIDPESMVELMCRMAARLRNRVA
jgi:aldehyde dehydrogenase (NAD+)